MKKLILLAAAIILIVAYMNYTDASAPAAVGKRLIADDAGEKQSEIMPAVKVMTYNIHRGINREGRLDLDGIAEVIKNSGAEIIALQEVERFSVRTKFQDQIGYLADKLSMQYAFGKSINILNGQYGNAILSRFPIEEYEVLQLSSEGEQRTLLKAAVNVNGHRTNFYSTHLGLKQSERDMQLEEIIRMAKGDGRFIIAGDFNTKVDKLSEITENNIDCSGFGTQGDKATFEAEGISERIDYIFVSGNFEVKGYDVLESEASDHYPAVSTLKFKN